MGYRCKYCKNRIRKNYPFGRKSKARITGHEKDCKFNK
jgi:hypothetical protein